ncbi:YceI family protein [Cohnella yongneupensis]|uniref:YceI family protein n=1 Tax=Cohnella yongneupensis TaxID=425006 RepID=A0ABW0R2E3_9BACL
MNIKWRKRNLWLLFSSFGILIVAAVGYWMYDYYAGNHIRIIEVIQEDAVDTAAASPAGGSGWDASLLDKQWNIAEGSQVYFSVKTSIEAVAFSLSKIEGSWDFHLQEPSRMKAHATIDVTSLDSGNGSRDNDIRGSSYLNVSAYPNATFELSSIEQWPDDRAAGEALTFKMNGALTVKGITKNVQFDCKTKYENGQLKLSGQTVVTFGDFGMRNPHLLVLNTENNVKISFQLVLS